MAGLIQRRREGKHNFYGLKTRQFSTLLDMLFAAMPEGSRKIRFDEDTLGAACRNSAVRYSPPPEVAAASPAWGASLSNSATSGRTSS